MSKKIYFKNINSEVVENINTILDIIFAHAYESKDLYKQGKELEKQSELLKGAIALGEDKKSELDEVTRKLNIVGFKKKAIVAWRKSSLYDTKDDAGNWDNGLYTSLGVTKDFAETWATCRSAQTWGKWNDAIRKMLSEVYGMDIKDDKLVSRFASYLEHVIGDDASGINDILKGILLKDKKSFSKFAEVFVRAIATYIASSCESVNIPTIEKYDARVEYDKNWTHVKNYKVVEKDAE